MSTGKAIRNTTSGTQPPPAQQAVVQEALEVTWTLKGHLKNAQIAYLRVGVLLAQVRDKKLYAALHHPDMESYAAGRLHLARASLYRYLQVHDWVAEYHKDWLGPKPKGFILNLADAADMVWIERALAQQDLEPAQRAALQELLERALNGQLRDGDLDRYRRPGRKADEGSLKSFLSKLRLLRKRGAALASMPPPMIADLDAAIAKLGDAVAGAPPG